MRWTKQQDDEILELRELGFTAREMAEKIGISKGSIDQRLVKLKIIRSPEYFTDIKRICSKCGQESIHKNKLSKMDAEKGDRQCRKCLAEDFKERFKGEGNPFYGKKHSEEVRQKTIERNKSRIVTEEWCRRSGEWLNAYSKLHPRKHPYEHWLVKFGKEVADQKMEELRKKYSVASSGERNPMYGKPTPKKAGNGWSGWYKDFYFRSLRELQFFIDHEGTEFVPIHLDRKYSVKYVGINGQNRTYSADFILNNELIIEVKPMKLWSTRENILKFEAMKEHCLKMGLEFQVVDVKPEASILKEKYLKGEIKFDKKCNDKFKKYCGIE